MIIIAAIFCVMGALLVIFSEIELYRSRRTKSRAEKILDEAAKMHDEANRLYMEIFKARGHRDLEKLANLACGIDEDPAA